jgi:glycosyltransferase involved in cell wall biosynthesis
MKVSVAMCTYNGAQFIEKQIKSIINQSVLVDEIVICDDRSTDDTTIIIREIALNTIVPIRLYINDSNLGCVRNFEKAISLCNGDLIFLSDQDDIWMNKKVEIITQWFDNNPAKNVVFGDAILIDENDKEIMKSQIPNAPSPEKKDIDEPLMLWECIGFSKLSQKQFDIGLGFELWLAQNRATGATMAFRKSFVNTIPIYYDDKNIYHDYAISIMSLVENSLDYIKTPLIYYRQHSNQAIGCINSIPLASNYDDARVWYECWIDMSQIPLPSKYIKRLSFEKERYFFKYSFMAISIIKNIYNYKLFDSAAFYMFRYDFTRSIKHSFNRMRKKILSLFYKIL